jgi:acyl carrier protein
MSKDEIKPIVKQYLLDEFLPGAEADELDDRTPLMSGGILDSISTTRLVAFLEERFGVTFEAHEMGIDYLDNLEDIASLVAEKSAS